MEATIFFLGVAIIGIVALFWLGNRDKAQGTKHDDLPPKSQRK